jgi:hypothetical protein
MPNAIDVACLHPDVPACNHCPLLIQVREGAVKLQVGSDVWKWIATTLGGALLAGFVFWMSWPSQAVTRIDMESFIRNYSPYAVDRNLVTQTLSRLETGQESQRIEMQALNARMQRLESLLQSHTGK